MEELKINEWYRVVDYPERGPGKLVDISSYRNLPYLLYHPQWARGHNGDSSTEKDYTGNHCYYYKAYQLASIPQEDWPPEEEE